VRATRALFAALVICAAPSSSFGQAMFWEKPYELATGTRIRHSSSSADGGLLAVAWEEIVPRTKGAEEGTIVLSVATSRDGKTWTNPNKGFFPPIPYKGLAAGLEPRVYSLTVDAKGRILVAVSRSERTVAILQSIDGGQSFQTNASLEASQFVVAPSLFESASGGFILLAAQASSGQAGEPLAISCSMSPDGKTWTAFAPLVSGSEPGAGVQLQPDHAVFQGRDYVVFQSQDERLAYQLSLKASADGGRTWEQARPITTGPQFSATIGSSRYGPGEFSNQRPRLTSLATGLGLVWERNLLGDNRPQIYYCEIDTTGTPTGAIEQVTTGASSVFARIVPFRKRLFVLYADSVAGGSRVTLAEKTRTWETQVLDRRGSSQFPHAAVLGESLFFFWEREESGAMALVDLSPDTSVGTPRLAEADPSPAVPSNLETAMVSWSRVDDSSGVREYRYTWSFGVGAKEAVKSSGSVLAVESAKLSSTSPMDQDGTWTFSVTAVDTAANISAPLKVVFIRDATPPGPVSFAGLPQQGVTALPTNDVTLAWNKPDPDVVSYRWEKQNVGASEAEYRVSPPALRLPPASQMVSLPEKKFQNLDNGLWAFTVQAVDAAGNVGPPTTAFALLGKYVPLAVAWSVLADTDQLGSMTLTIRGKGFLTAGRVEKVFLDEDGRAPYDLTYEPGPDGFTITADGKISGPRLTNDTRPGLYRVGILHPTRGAEPWFVPGVLIRFKSPGTVKIGDFELPLPNWIAGRLPRFAVGVDALLVVSVVGFLAVLAILAARRVAAIAREGAAVTAEVLALVEGRPSAGWEERKRKMRELRRKGAGLRLKFTMLVVVLVIIVVLIVAVPLGLQMTNNQRAALATGLSKQSEILIGSIASAAMNQIKLGDQGYAPIADVPGSRLAMSEAQYATITGPSPDAAANANPDVARDFVWASDEKSWKELRDSGRFSPAKQPAADELAKEGVALAFQKEIDGRLVAALDPLVSKYRDIRAQMRALSGKTDKASIARYNELLPTLGPLGTEIDKQLEEQLTALGPFRSYPVFDARTPVDTYIFYYPVVYFTPDDSFFSHGLVRLAIGTKTIRDAIARAQLALVRTTGGIALLAVALGVLGAIILASITVTPIRRLVKGVATIRDTEDKEELKSHTINVGTRDEIGLLAETVNDMTQGLVKAAMANKELLLGKDVQKMFLPLEKDDQGRKSSTAGEQTPLVEIYGYYEGAKGVSGDYFDFKKLDEAHYAFIKCDVAGKGVSAALIMVEVATLFISYFRDWQKRKENILSLADQKARQKASGELERVDSLVYTINDMLEERGFKGRFAALTIGVINLEAGTATICNAGDNLLHVYETEERRMVLKKLPESPAAGVFPSMLVEMKSGFPQVRERLDRGDALFLFTDGFEEAKRSFRDASFEVVACSAPEVKEGEPHLGTHSRGQTSEEFGSPRMDGVVNAVFGRGRYQLVRHHIPVANEELTFDFSRCEGTVREAVLALVAVEKVFRTITDPRAGAEQKVVVDTKIDVFLKEHFVQYQSYFSHRVDGPPGASVTFTNLREDEQYDDLTILVIRRK
jgi:HAMP domain-containing protein